ncbi:Nucleolar pre-ribosomal-associated protein 1 [Nymphon striatum]|nr:Nucleolar pre-ribosomal-associated protein 1 [Nymphon striatum]
MEKFTTFALKNGMKYHGQDLNLLKMLAYLYKKEDVNGLVTTATVYTMTISHSKFLSIMFDTAKAQQPQKECLLDLMLSLVQSDNNICSEKHIPVFLGAYSATFSVIDRKLLKLMYLYEKSEKVNFHPYRPFLWGQTAISHYSVLKNISMALVKQTKMEDVLQLIDLNLLVKSAIQFPLNLPLEVCIVFFFIVEGMYLYPSLW